MNDSNSAVGPLPYEEGQTACSRYGALEQDRFIFLQRAREAAEYTIPMLFPPEGHNSTTRYYTPFQSIGARGCNNLASKLLLALFPPEASFFRLNLDPKLEREIEEGQGAQEDDIDKFDEALSDMEQKAVNEVNGRKARVTFNEAFLQLVVGGNCLVHIPKKKTLRAFKLDQYVVQRDPDGDVLEIVVKERVAPNALPDSIKQYVLDELRKEAEHKEDREKKQHGDEKTVDVYTWIRRGPKNWTICQEVKGKDIPESEGTYPLDKCPWLALRWKKIDNENYGRGLCEEYIGDLASLESLTKMLVQAGAVAGKVLIMVKPNGSTRPEAFANKENGAIIEGDPEDVKAFQLDKNLDLQFASNLVKEIEGRLGFAFLLNSAIQRQGERVTAEEIRMMAGELEDALGGVYSLLADDLQRPLAEIILMQMEAAGELPKLPKGAVSISVVTGLDALGRTHELARLDQFLNGANQIIGQQTVATYLNVGDYLSRRAAALGIRQKGLIKSEQEVQAMQQQQQQAAMAAKLGPAAMQAGSKISAAQMQQQQQQEGEQAPQGAAAPQ